MNMLSPIKSDYVSIDAYGRQGEAQADIRATPFVFTDPASIPARQWVYGRHLIRRFVSVTVAPGGVGKSSLLIAEALALVTGKPLLGIEVKTPRRVWLWNLEDPSDELQRRFQAACQHYGITSADIGDRLFVDSGRTQELCTAVMGKGRAVLRRPVIDALTDELRANQIDVLIVDPFVSSHAVCENDNPAMDMVSKEWGRVADKTNSAISLVHHTRKQSDGEVSAESSRGAKALTDAARDVRAINRMTANEADKAGVENHRLYFRVYSDKCNLAPPADKSDWFTLQNVELANGDHVGVVSPWAWPDPFADITVTDLRSVQEAIAGKNYRKDVRSPDWVGVAIGKVIGVDIEDKSGKEKVKLLLKTWLDNGVLKTVTVTNESRNKVALVEVGEWAA